MGVGHEPLNKAADANSCFFVISWVLDQAQGFGEGEEETEALRGGLAGHWKWGLVSPSNCPIVSMRQAFGVNLWWCRARGTRVNAQTSGQALTGTAGNGASGARGWVRVTREGSWGTV